MTKLVPTGTVLHKTKYGMDIIAKGFASQLGCEWKDVVFYLLTILGTGCTYTTLWEVRLMYGRLWSVSSG